MTVTTGSPMASRIRRGLGWSTASNLVLRIGNFCVSIIMARLIAPEQFGIFAVALTMWNVLGTLAEFGLGTDLVRSSDIHRRIPTVATLGLLTSGTLAGGMFLAAPLIASAFNSPESTSVLRLMAIGMVVFGFSIVPSAVLQREFRQGTLFAINGTALVVSTATMTVMALREYGPVALAVGVIVTQVVSVIGQYAATRLPIRLGFDRQIASESARFCLPLAAANLLSWVLLSIDNLLVARVLSPVELGLYVLAFNVSSWPMNAIGQAVRVIALPAFSHLGDPELRNQALARVIGPLWAVAVLLGVGLATTAEPVVRVLYGDRWARAGLALAGLGAFGAVRVVTDLLSTYLVAVGLTRTVLVVQVVWLVGMVPAMYAAVSWFGLAGAGWAHLAVTLGIALPAYLIGLRRMGLRAGPILRAGLVPTLVIVPTGLAGWYLTRAISSPSLSIAAAGGTAILLYVLPLSRWWLGQIRSLRTVEES